jgi:hypothetical protein
MPPATRPPTAEQKEAWRDYIQFDHEQRLRAIEAHLGIERQGPDYSSEVEELHRQAYAHLEAQVEFDRQHGVIDKMTEDWQNRQVTPLPGVAFDAHADSREERAKRYARVFGGER